uniref:Reverse transcriptase domain-containing protein n=1 Tax=Tanacetum cinerariifolium TaxID=118510 RepID=A0A6L2NTI9_TANCI|nr:reverse transcriptase domain-containing protein [Tanacetum cinerariifolium]
MSSPNHPTSDIEDAFSSNSPNYTPTSPDYSPASLGNTPFESSNNSYEFFVPEELLPLKEQVSYLTSASTNLSNPSRKQACTLPSFSVYTPTLPQIFEIGKSSIKMHLKHHVKLIEDILNYLEELSFHRIKKTKERLVNGWMIIQRDYDELKTKIEKVRSQISILQKKHIGQKDKIAFARFRISTLEITLKDIQASQAANMVNADNTNRNPELREVLVARKCSYKEFMRSKPFNFKEEAYKLFWVEFKKLLIKKYCPRTEVQKMEDEFYHLTVKENDLNTYMRKFQELATLCPNMVPNTNKLMEDFIGGLPLSIKGNVTASKP